MAEFNPYQRDRNYEETGSCLMVWTTVMTTIVFCFSLLELNMYLLEDYNKLFFFLLTLCIRMQRKVLAVKPPTE